MSFCESCSLLQLYWYVATRDWTLDILHASHMLCHWIGALWWDMGMSVKREQVLMAKAVGYMRRWVGSRMRSWWAISWTPRSWKVKKVQSAKVGDLGFWYERRYHIYQDLELLERGTPKGKCARRCISVQSLAYVRTPNLDSTSYQKYVFHFWRAI